MRNQVVRCPRCAWCVTLAPESEYAADWAELHKALTGHETRDNGTRAER